MRTRFFPLAVIAFVPAVAVASPLAATSPARTSSRWRIDNSNLTGQGFVFYAVETTTDGNAVVEHVITADQWVSGGDFTLTFNGAATAALPITVDNTNIT